MAIKTFKQLRTEALSWMADQDDAGLMDTLVGEAIKRSHQKILTSEMYDFMLWPTIETLDVEPNRKLYTLHPQYLQGLLFFNPQTKEYLEEIPVKALLESEENWQDGQDTQPERFMITSITGVEQQPATPLSVTVSTILGSEQAANAIIIQGIDVGGNYQQEILTSGANWTSLSGTVIFAHIMNITKAGESWTRDIIVSSGATTIVRLNVNEYGKQFRQLELTHNPLQIASIVYRFYRKPRELNNDFDIPDIPEQFNEVLVLDALMKMQGYTRATDREFKLWQEQYAQLMTQMDQTYQMARTLGSRQRYVRFIPRI